MGFAGLLHLSLDPAPLHGVLRQITIDPVLPGVSLSDRWDILGPFRLGKRG